jgi:hypothetical protein
MKEGYSGKVMQDLYDQDVRRPALHERPFTGYPLHRAVYDRLHLLVPRISQALAAREGRIRILSAPCGLAEDVFRAVEQARSITGRAIEVEFTALDLDPNGRIAQTLVEKGRATNVDVRFAQGYITKDTTWSPDLSGPYDIVVFVGLSSWLPKPDMVQHFQRLRGLVKEDGVLVTDTFTAGAYALSGYYAGYRAHYYEPSVYASLLDVSGFKASPDAFESGRDGLNYVTICSPRFREVDLNRSIGVPGEEIGDGVEVSRKFLNRATSILKSKVSELSRAGFDYVSTVPALKIVNRKLTRSLFAPIQKLLQKSKSQDAGGPSLPIRKLSALSPLEPGGSRR